MASSWKAAPLFFLSLSCSVPPRGQDVFILSSGDLSLEISRGGEFLALRSLPEQKDLLASDSPPVFSVQAVRPDGSTFELDSSMAEEKQVGFAESDPSVLLMQFLRVGGYDVDVRCQVRLEKDSDISFWSLKARNGSQLAFRKLFFPVVQATLPFGKEAKDDRLLFPFLDGHVFIDPKHSFREKSEVRFQYPGQVCAQLMALYSQGRSHAPGLYLAAYDSSGHIKHFRAQRRGDFLDLSLEHNLTEERGAPYELPYQVGVGIFRGGWQTAADIYKEWAWQQPWTRKDVVEKGTPKYLVDGDPLLTFYLRGPTMAGEWSLYFPPSNRTPNPRFLHERVPALIKEYSQFLGSDVIAVPFGWEQHGPWIGAEYFPPFGGEGQFRQMVDALAGDGHHLGLFHSGLRYAVRQDSVDYDGWGIFNREVRRSAALSPRGEIRLEHPPWSESAQLCIGSAEARQRLHGDFVAMMEHGASVGQYDQNHGAMAFVCYSQEHSHLPGYGDWMTRETVAWLEAIREEALKRKQDFALSVEEPCEFFIPYFDVYVGRPQNFFGTGSIPEWRRDAVPLFVYLYHPFLLGYGGFNEMDIASADAELIRLARKFVLGVNLEIYLHKPSFDLRLRTPEQQLLKNLVRARKTYARDYLAFGEMLPVASLPDAAKRTVHEWRDPRDTRPWEDLRTLEIPTVLHSAWRLKDGRIGYTLVNMTVDEEMVNLALKKDGPEGAQSFRVLRHDLHGTMELLSATKGLPDYLSVKIAPLSATLLEQIPMP